jgi:hypothetical protein
MTKTTSLHLVQRSEPVSVKKALPKSYAHRPDGKFHPRENPIKKDTSSAVIRRNTALNTMARRSDNTSWSYTPSGHEFRRTYLKVPC